MRAPRRLAVLLSLVLAGCGGGHRAAEPSTSPSPAPTLETLLHHKGSVLPYEAVAAAIAFRPFIPSRRPIGIALIPPFRGADAADRRGIGFEYESDGALFVLQEWPLSGPEPTAYLPARVRLDGCTRVYRFPVDAGLITTTASSRIYALQIDGPKNPELVRKEAVRLVSRGLCRA
jgi:hypothetical protein